MQAGTASELRGASRHTTSSHSRIWHSFLHASTGGALVALVLALPLTAASYRFTKILDATTLRPDGLGRFYVGIRPTNPAFDGRWVVFRDPGPQNDDGSRAAIWSFDTRNNSFRKLVDANTAVPGRPGTFFYNISLVNAAPVVRNGVVVFIARDTKAKQGLYAVPAGGGAIVLLADAETPDPQGGTFTVFDSSDSAMGAFAFDGSAIAFNASGSALGSGNYSVLPNGTALRLVAAGPAMGGKILNFYSPAISSGNVLMLGTSGLPMPTGSFYDGLYLSDMAGGRVTELLNSAQRLPGNSNAAPLVRYDWPVLALDGNLAAFHATDLQSVTRDNPDGFSGLFAYNLATREIGAVAHANSTLPELGTPAFIAAGGVSVSQGTVLFRAGDTAGMSALYVWKDGVTSRAVGRGDPFDGLPVQSIGEPGPYALSGASFAFIAGFGGLNYGIYVATPIAAAPTLAAVANSASNAIGAISPGEIVTLAGSDFGPASLAVGPFDANGRLPFELAGVRVLFNDVPAPLVYVSDRAHAAVVPFDIGIGKDARIVVQYNNALSNTITAPVENTAPGIFSANMSGSGQGAILNSDLSYNSALNPAEAGSVVVLYLTGLGALNPKPLDGGTVSASPATTLQYPIEVTIAGQTAVTLYQGPAPEQLAGLYQINCVVPPGTPPGAATVVVRGDGRLSQPNLTVAVR